MAFSSDTIIKGLTTAVGGEWYFDPATLMYHHSSGLALTKETIEDTPVDEIESMVKQWFNEIEQDNLEKAIKEAPHKTLNAMPSTFMVSDNTVVMTKQVTVGVPDNQVVVLKKLKPGVAQWVAKKTYHDMMYALKSEQEAETFQVIWDMFIEAQDVKYLKVSIPVHESKTPGPLLKIQKLSDEKEMLQKEIVSTEGELHGAMAAVMELTDQYQRALEIISQYQDLVNSMENRLKELGQGAPVSGMVWNLALECKKLSINIDPLQT